MYINDGGLDRGPEEPAAHLRIYLALLPSGPDAVRRLGLHRFRTAVQSAHVIVLYFRSSAGVMVRLRSSAPRSTASGTLTSMRSPVSSRWSSSTPLTGWRSNPTIRSPSLRPACSPGLSGSSDATRTAVDVVRRWATVSRRGRGTFWP